MTEVKDLVDLKALMKQYGIIIYMGDLEAELDLIWEDCKELYQMGMIEKNTLSQIMRVIAHTRKSLPPTR